MGLSPFTLQTEIDFKTTYCTEDKERFVVFYGLENHDDHHGKVT